MAGPIGDLLEQTAKGLGRAGARAGSGMPGGTSPAGPARDISDLVEQSIPNKQHPELTFRQRQELKFWSEEHGPEAVGKKLEEFGFESRPIEYSGWNPLKHGQYAIRRPGGEWYRVEESGIPSSLGELGADIADYSGDAIKDVVSTIYGAAGFAGGTAVGGPVGGLAGATGMAVLGGAAAQGAKQTVGELLGYHDISGREAMGAMGREAAIQGAGELAGRAVIDPALRATGRGLKKVYMGATGRGAKEAVPTQLNFFERPPAEAPSAKALKETADIPPGAPELNLPPAHPDARYMPRDEGFVPRGRPEPDPTQIRVAPDDRFAPPPDPDARWKSPQAPRIEPEAPAPEPARPLEEFEADARPMIRGGSDAAGPVGQPYDRRVYRPEYDPLPPKGSVVEVSSLDIGVDPKTYQLRSDVDARGVKASREIKEPWDPVQAGTLVLYRDKSGKLWVIDGHHRLAKAKETGERVNAFVMDAVRDDMDERGAMAFGAMRNIIEDNGEIEDFARYFRNADISREAAEKKGLLKWDKGRQAWHLGKDAGPDVYGAWLDRRLTDGQAIAIARSAPGDAGRQSAALKYIERNPKVTLDELAAFTGSLQGRAPKQSGPVQGDILGFDDAAIRESEAIAKVIKDDLRKLRRMVSAKGAVRNTEEAADLGVRTLDVDAAKKRIAELEEMKRYISSGKIYTNRELVNEIRVRAGLEPLGAKPRAEPPASAVGDVAEPDFAEPLTPPKPREKKRVRVEETAPEPIGEREPLELEAEPIGEGLHTRAHQESARKAREVRESMTDVPLDEPAKPVPWSKEAVESALTEAKDLDQDVRITVLKNDGNKRVFEQTRLTQPKEFPLEVKNLDPEGVRAKRGQHDIVLVYERKPGRAGGDKGGLYQFRSFHRDKLLSIEYPDGRKIVFTGQPKATKRVRVEPEAEPFTKPAEEITSEEVIQPEMIATKPEETKKPKPRKRVRLPEATSPEKLEGVPEIGPSRQPDIPLSPRRPTGARAPQRKPIWYDSPEPEPRKPAEIPAVDEAEAARAREAFREKRLAERPKPRRVVEDLEAPLPKDAPPEALRWWQSAGKAAGRALEEVGLTLQIPDRTIDRILNKYLGEEQVPRWARAMIKLTGGVGTVHFGGKWAGIALVASKFAGQGLENAGKRLQKIAMDRNAPAAIRQAAKEAIKAGKKSPAGQVIMRAVLLLILESDEYQGGEKPSRRKLRVRVGSQGRQ